MMAHADGIRSLSEIYESGRTAQSQDQAVTVGQACAEAPGLD
jgi:hypothetical protein